MKKIILALVVVVPLFFLLPAPLFAQCSCAPNADYGDYSDKTAWCACAASCGDNGSLINGNCPQAPQSNTCQADCKYCPATTDKCGNYVYQGSCNYSTCTSEDATYTCVSSGNSVCQGSYRCGTRCAPGPTPTSVPKSTPTPTPTKTTPTSTPRSTSTPTIKPTSTPLPVTISGLTINGVEVTPQTGSQQKLKLPISDLSKEASSIIPVLVRYSDNTNKDFFINFKFQPRQTVNNEFLVDIIIHKSLTNYEEVADWAKDTVNIYINNRFASAGIKHRLQVDQIVTNYDKQNGCPFGGNQLDNRCIFKDNSRIRVWLYKNGQADTNLTTSADTGEAQVWMNIPAYHYLPEDTPLSEIDRRTLTHEIGHLFKMPDYYNEFIGHIFNEVVPIEIAPYAKDIMYRTIYDHFSETSKGFADRTNLLPAGWGSPFWDFQYTPKRNILKIIDDNNLPLSGVKVEGFSAIWRYTGNIARRVIPNTITYSGFTDKNGEFDLGDHTEIFNNPGNSSAGTALLRLTYGDKLLYTAITRSYLHTLYFQGQTEAAVITKPFSSLVAYDPNKTTILSARRPILSGDGGISTEQPLTDDERKLLDEHLNQHLEDEQLTTTTTNEPVKKITSISTPTPTPKSATLISSTPSPTSTPKPSIFDLNSDGSINAFDSSRFLEDWRSGILRDFNGDEITNSIDYALLKKEFVK